MKRLVASKDFGDSDITSASGSKIIQKTQKDDSKKEDTWKFKHWVFLFISFHLAFQGDFFSSSIVHHLFAEMLE